MTPVWLRVCASLQRCCAGGTCLSQATRCAEGCACLRWGCCCRDSLPCCWGFPAGFGHAGVQAILTTAELFYGCDSALPGCNHMRDVCLVAEPGCLLLSTQFCCHHYLCWQFMEIQRVISPEHADRLHSIYKAVRTSACMANLCVVCLQSELLEHQLCSMTLPHLPVLQ